MRFRLVAMAATLCVALSSCGPQGETKVGKTIAGASTQLTEWHHISPSEFPVKLRNLKGVTIIKSTERRVRDNHIGQHRAHFGHGGYIWVEHLSAPHAVFGLRGSNRVNSVDWVLDTARKFFKKRNHTMTVGEKRRIHKYGDRGGWLVFVSNEEHGRACLVARMGFLNNANKARSSGEHYDTYVYFRDCTRQNSMDEVEAFLRGLKLVS